MSINPQPFRTGSQHSLRGTEADSEAPILTQRLVSRFALSALVGKARSNSCISESIDVGNHASALRLAAAEVDYKSLLVSAGVQCELAVQ